jgi:hypothetical protein
LDEDIDGIDVASVDAVTATAALFPSVPDSAWYHKATVVLLTIQYLAWKSKRRDEEDDGCGACCSGSKAGEAEAEAEADAAFNAPPSELLLLSWLLLSRLLPLLELAGT